MSTTRSEPQTVKFRGVDDLVLVADEWNRGTDSDRPSILLLHGGGQNRYSWKNTGQVLADESFHVVALDSRGHGDSDRSADATYTVSRNLELAIGLKNLLDENFELAWGFPQPGRTYYVKTRMTF